MNQRTDKQQRKSTEPKASYLKRTIKSTDFSWTEQAKRREGSVLKSGKREGLTTDLMEIKHLVRNAMKN